MPMEVVVPLPVLAAYIPRSCLRPGSLSASCASRARATIACTAVAHRADAAGLELLIARAYQAEERVDTHGDEVAAVLYEPDRVEPGGEHYLIAITAMELDLFQRVLIERAERVGRRVAGAKELVHAFAEIGQRKWLEERGEGPLDSRLECSALHWHARIVASVVMMLLNHDTLCGDGLCMVRAPQCDRLADRLRTSGTLLPEPLHRQFGVGRPKPRRAN